VNKETPTLHEPGCRCMACACGQRNRFFKGKMMKAPEFEMEQRYSIERRRMLTRSISGWGVVRGFAVKGGHEERIPFPEPRPFCVSPGLAIDPHGREILLTEESLIGSDNTFVIGPNCELQSVDRLEPGEYVLAIHYAECLLGDTPLPDDCCGTQVVKNYVCETALFSLRKLCRDEKCPCGEKDCPEGCKCHRHRCLCGKRARNACLCEWVARTEAPGCSEKPCGWHGYEVWVDDGVDLACIHISCRAENCKPPLGVICDDCDPRRIVKNNDLLYNLIRGCDLTCIECLSWGHWHRQTTPVPWEEFIHMLKVRVEGEVLVTGLCVHFTGPVLARTVTPDCFTLQFAIGKGELHTRLVEIVHVLTPHHHEDPDGTTRTAILCVRPEWFEDVECHGSKIRKEGALVRIEVNGDFILDCHCQPVDAHARGFALREIEGEPRHPGGNGTPGGALISVFKVARAPEPRPVYYAEEKNSE